LLVVGLLFYSFSSLALTNNEASILAHKEAKSICSDYKVINELKDFSKDTKNQPQWEVSRLGSGRYMITVWATYPVIELYFECNANTSSTKDNNEIDTSKVIAASSGTGFFVSTNGHIVTNYHVIDSCNDVKAHYKGKIVNTDILYNDRTNDLSIIKANLKPNKVFSISNEDVSLLEDIIVAGYPLGKEISASIKTFKGSVTALSGYGDNYSNFQIDASLNSGNSGGPILDQKGNIVGVAVAKWIEDGVEGFNFGVKSSTLKTFASSNQFKFQDPSTEELSNKELGQLITEATIYLECWMSVAKIKQIIQEGERQKAFFSEYK
jgi:S1-C subfamily serine protease